jgi:hypothetical protein
MDFFFYVPLLYLHILSDTQRLFLAFQKTKILYSGTPKTYTLIMIKIDNIKFPIAINRTQIGNLKCKLQAMIADGTIHTKKTNKNLLDSVIINPVCDFTGEIC